VRQPAAPRAIDAWGRRKTLSRSQAYNHGMHRTHPAEHAIQLQFSLRNALVAASRGRRVWAVLFRIFVLSTALASAVPLHGADTGVAIAWNDFGANRGMLGLIGASEPWPALQSPIPVGLDSVLHSAFGKLYVLSDGDRTVRVVDPIAWTVERSHALGPSDELVDIKAVSPDIAYITRRNAKQLLRLDLRSGMTEEVLDLGVLADPDGVPDLGTMTVHDGRLFIQLQRQYFDGPPPYPRPFIAVMDISSEQLIDTDPVRDGLQAIELAGTFPKMKMQVVQQTQKLFVSATGAFFDAGGIEMIDLNRLRTDGLVIREADDFTGADLGAFVMVTPDRGFLAYSTDLLLSSHLHQFSLTTGVDQRELAVALNYFSPAIEFDSATNSVFFPVGGMPDDGLLAFDATTGTQLSGQLIATSGPPTDLALVAAIPEPAGLALALAATLPFVCRAFKRYRQ
jgi:hypothetical protein